MFNIEYNTNSVNTVTKKSNFKNKEITIFEEIKSNILLTDNENFFKSGFDKSYDKVVKIINTGVGKTYNSAYLALYTLFYTNRKIVISTTKNDNVDDFIQEIQEILKNNLQQKTENIEKFINDFDYKELKICILNTASNYNKEEIKESRIVITNHSYLFTHNHSIELRKSTKNLIDSIKENTIFLVDEIDELEKQSLIEIPLNKFYKHCKTIDNAWIEKTSNCFSSYDGKYYKDNIDDLRYTLPREEIHSRHEKIGEYETPTFLIDTRGNQVLIDLIEKYFDFIEEKQEIGRREGFYIFNKKDNSINPEMKEWNLIRVEQIKRLVLKENVNLDNTIDSEIIKLILQSHGACIIRQVIKLTNKTRNSKNEIFHEDLQTFESNQAFIDFCKYTLNNNELYDTTVINRLMKEGSELYKEKLIIRRKSILEILNCKKYMFTATPSILHELDYNLEYCKLSGPNTIEKIDIFFFQREKGIDQTINKHSINEFQNKNFDVLSFLSLHKNLKSLSSNKKIINNQKYENINLISSINEGTIDIKPHEYSLVKKTENYGIKNVNVKISYLNGNESTGKNYCDTDICIINCKHDINISSRVILKDNHSKHDYLDIEKASFRTIIQAGGRIERTKNKQQKYKALILFGDNPEIAQQYISHKQGNGIEYTVYNCDNFKKILNEIELKINKYNHGIYDNPDKRNKFDQDEIMKFYLNQLEINNNKKMLAIKEVMSKFGISEPGFKKIRKTYL